MNTDGEVATFVIWQEMALQDCEARRRGLVDLIDAYGKATKPVRKVFGVRVGF